MFIDFAQIKCTIYFLDNFFTHYTVQGGIAGKL